MVQCTLTLSGLSEKLALHSKDHCIGFGYKRIIKTVNRQNLNTTFGLKGCFRSFSYISNMNKY